MGARRRLVLSAAARTQMLQPRLLQLFDVVSRSPHSYKYLRFLANRLLLIFTIKSFSHLKIIFMYTVYFPQLQCPCPILLSYIYVCVYIYACVTKWYMSSLRTLPASKHYKKSVRITADLGAGEDNC